MDINKSPEKPLHTYSIDDQFELYLKLVHIDKREIPPYQLKQMRQCFFGAFGQFLFIAQELEGCTAQEASAAIKSLQTQVSEFFDKPTQKP
jgi:hypothetical protein